MSTGLGAVGCGEHGFPGAGRWWGGRPYDARTSRIKDLPFGHRPLEVIWRKRRYRCPLASPRPRSDQSPEGRADLRHLGARSAKLHHHRPTTPPQTGDPPTVRDGAAAERLHEVDQVGSTVQVRPRVRAGPLGRRRDRHAGAGLSDTRFRSGISGPRHSTAIAADMDSQVSPPLVASR